MCFIAAFISLVAAGYAFLLAILTPNWSQYTTSSGTVQKGIFYECTLISQNSTYETKQCFSVITADSSTGSTSIWKYQFAISSASIAIGCAGLSVLTLFLCGAYFNVRARTTCGPCYLVSISLLSLLTFFSSAAVWILHIVEILVIGQSVDRSIFNWPMWVAVGATGGFLVAFLSTVIACCRRGHRRRSDHNNQYTPGNKF